MTTNSYCQKLGIAVPRVEDAVPRRGMNLHGLMVVALLERGGPMTIEEIADRLELANAACKSGDMALSLTKAWAGREPIFKDAQGRFALDLNYSGLDLMLFIIGARGPKSPLPANPPQLKQPPDDSPLTAEEVESALKHISAYQFSAIRRAAAILDVHSAPMPLAEVNRRIVVLTGPKGTVSAVAISGWRSTLVTQDGKGRLILDRASPDLAPVRRAIRKLAYVVLRRKALHDYYDKAREEAEARCEAREELESATAQAMRRAVIRVLPTSGEPQAVAVLDVERREIRTLIGDDVPKAGDWLRQFQVLAGLDLRDSMAALGLDADQWRLIDLRPPQKTLQLNRRGRTLKITSELLIRGTTRISRPLSEPRRVQGYLSGGDAGKLARRLEADAKALFAYYHYGRMHNYVRLRWGFIDDVLRVGWALPGERHLFHVIQEAIQGGAHVDLVVGSAPGWSDPWSRAWRVKPLSIGPWQVVAHDGRAEVPVDRREIQAVRVSTGAGTGETAGLTPDLGESLESEE